MKMSALISYSRHLGIKIWKPPLNHRPPEALLQRFPSVKTSSITVKGAADPLFYWQPEHTLFIRITLKRGLRRLRKLLSLSIKSSSMNCGRETWIWKSITPQWSIDWRVSGTYRCCRVRRNKGSSDRRKSTRQVFSLNGCFLWRWGNSTGASLRAMRALFKRSKWLKCSISGRLNMNSISNRKWWDVQNWIQSPAVPAVSMKEEAISRITFRINTWTMNHIHRCKGMWAWSISKTRWFLRVHLLLLLRMADLWWRKMMKRY